MIHTLKGRQDLYIAISSLIFVVQTRVPVRHDLDASKNRQGLILGGIYH